MQISTRRSEAQPAIDFTSRTCCAPGRSRSSPCGNARPSWQRSRARRRFLCGGGCGESSMGVLMVLRACIDCGALSDQAHCPEHRGKRRNGSTSQWRKTRAAVLKRDNYVCFFCGKRATTVDHLHARSRGGTDDEANLVAACAGCNGAKGDMTAAEFGSIGE